MHGQVNAIGLMACVALTIGVLVVADKRPATIKRAGLAILIAAWAAITACVLSMHLCDRGNPLTQWLVPAACVVPVFCKAAHPRLRRSAATLLFIAAIALSFHFSLVVHQEGYTGNSRSTKRSAQARLLWLARELEDPGAEETGEAPQGWLREVVPTMSDGAAMRLREIDSIGRVSAFWHTCLTGIWRVELAPADVWCLGRSAENGGLRLELRERPRPY